MLAGHYALAAAVKAKTPEVPLWALMLSTQLPDVLFGPLLVAGVETMSGTGYGQFVFGAYYTHSLGGVLLLAALAGILAGRAWGRRAGYTIAAVAASHWVLDLLVHHADLPILPGNAGHLPLLGFGLWSPPAVGMSLEALLILVGGYLYIRSALERARMAAAVPGGRPATGRAIVAGGVLVTLLISALVIA